MRVVVPDVFRLDEGDEGLCCFEIVGTPSFYDMAATSEYVKSKILGRMEAGVDRAKAKCSEAQYMGITDGARGKWDSWGSAPTCE